MCAYQERFAIGSPVRIAPRAELEAFRREWTYHNPLSHDQLSFADRESVVAEVGFYHGGDPLYVLVDIPGVWHEACLTAVSANSIPKNESVADQLHAAILGRGYSLIASVDSPKAFGSWYREYEQAGRTARLIWDGKDQWFVLQTGPQWHDVAIRRPSELKADGVDQFLNRLPTG